MHCLFFPLYDHCLFQFLIHTLPNQCLSSNKVSLLQSLRTVKKIRAKATPRPKGNTNGGDSINYLDYLNWNLKNLGSEWSKSSTYKPANAQLMHLFRVKALCLKSRVQQEAVPQCQNPEDCLQTAHIWVGRIVEAFFFKGSFTFG